MNRSRWLLVFSFSVILTVAADDLRGTGDLQRSEAIQQLTTDPAIDVRPIWSPDGRHIAFQSNRSGTFSVWTMEADGQNQREVTASTSNDRHPAWSPDGAQLVYDSDAVGLSEIWIVDRDGQNLRQLTSLGAFSNFPSWSPDGSQVSFYVYENGQMSLWAAQADGSNVWPVVPDLANERRNECTFACHQAAWSPDGKRIAYTGGDQRSIWLVNADGQDPTEIVSGSVSKEQNHFPWFVSDSRLAFLTEHSAGNFAPFTDAWVVDLASGELTLLVGRVQHQGPLGWSSDGTKVVFHSPRSGNFDIYVADLAVAGGQEALQATAAPPPLRPTAAAPEAPAADEAVGPQSAPSAVPTVVAAEPAAPEGAGDTRTTSPVTLGAIAVGLLALGVITAFVVRGAVRRSRRS